MKSDITSRGWDTGKMALWLSCCWIVVLCGGGDSVLSTSTPTFTINYNELTFEDAMKTCNLTTLATDQEVTKILSLVSVSVRPQSNSAFWVGLRINKKECVFPRRPLRGFKWVQDGSEESQVSQWLEEPDDTCTAVRCAILQVQVEQSAVKRWGLIPVRCANAYNFICKSVSTSTPAAPEPASPKPAVPEPPEPPTPKPSLPELPEPATPKPSLPELPEPATPKPSLPELPEPAIPTPTVYEPPEPPTTVAPEARPPLEPGPCPFPSVLNSRAFTPDPNNRSRIQVECWWSAIQVELYCWGSPVVWRLLDHSPANLTSICQRCDSGFQKDTSGNCVDVDECSDGSARCRHTCVNTEGSFKCVCSDQDGEDSSACTGAMTTAESSLPWHIVIPVLVVVAVLVVVLVVIALTVKCCLKRRSKKRPAEDKEKM
ncbi:hypothetical protein INR49_007219 [Caranx melampygus]|nr:hypothetical protein INR49_007219 [Caranx melampygus]